MILKFFGLMSLFSLFANATPLGVGSAAPEVTAPDENGAAIHFADYYKKGPTLVYFYPKADTPGCTKQACTLRDSFSSLQARGLQILGVSGDKVVSQKAFKEKYHLPFPLIADHEGVVAKAFGVPTLLGIAKRQSFLINEGRVVWNDLSVSPGTHTAEVAAALDALKH